MTFVFRRRAQNWSGSRTSEASRKLASHPGQEAASFVIEALGEFRFEGQVRARPTSMRREAGGHRHEDLQEGLINVEVEIIPTEGLKQIIDVPVTVRNARMERPVMFLNQGVPYVLSQTALDQILQYSRFEYPQYPERNNQFVLPNTRRSIEAQAQERPLASEAMMPGNLVYNEEPLPGFPEGSNFEVTRSFWKKDPSTPTGKQFYVTMGHMESGKSITVSEDELDAKFRLTEGAMGQKPKSTAWDRTKPLDEVPEMPGEQVSEYQVPESQAPESAEDSAALAKAHRIPKPRSRDLETPNWPLAHDSHWDENRDPLAKTERRPSWSGGSVYPDTVQSRVPGNQNGSSNQKSAAVAGRYQVGDMFAVTSSDLGDGIGANLPAGTIVSVEKVRSDASLSVRWVTQDGEEHGDDWDSDWVDGYVEDGWLTKTTGGSPKTCPICAVFPSHARKHNKTAFKNKTAATEPDAISWSATLMVHPDTILGGSTGSNAMVRSTLDVAAKDTGWREEGILEWRRELRQGWGVLGAEAYLRVKDFNVTKLPGGGLQIDMEGLLKSDNERSRSFFLDDFLHAVVGPGGNLKIRSQRPTFYKYAQTQPDAIRFDLHLLLNPKTAVGDDIKHEVDLLRQSPMTWLRKEIHRCMSVMGLKDSGRMVFADPSNPQMDKIKIKTFDIQRLSQGGYEATIEGVAGGGTLGTTEKELKDWVEDTFAYIYNTDGRGLSKTTLKVVPTFFRYAKLNESR